MKPSKRIICLIPALIALILEILPFGAVVIFAPSPDSRKRELYSYFDLLPFGYANFAPFLTAVCTCVILLLLVISLKKRFVKNAAFVLSVVGAALSLMPLLFGIEFYPPVGALITLMLIAECVLLKLIK